MLTKEKSILQPTSLNQFKPISDRIRAPRQTQTIGSSRKIFNTSKLSSFGKFPFKTLRHFLSKTTLDGYTGN